MILHVRVLDTTDPSEDGVLLTVSLAVGESAPELELRRERSTTATWRSDLCELLHDVTSS